MIIDCIADLHGYRPKLDGGDLLIIAGDLTSQDKPYQYIEFALWLEKQNYKKKIVIGGNHDNVLEKCSNCIDAIPNTRYLCDSGTEFEGLKIWGSPWTTKFKGINPHCCAFTVDSDLELADKWDMIPDQVDILVTHNPSFGNFDIVSSGESVGSLSLWLTCLSIKPKLHVFGHIHESYGHALHYNGINLVNASHVNEKYEPVNMPIRVIL